LLVIYLPTSAAVLTRVLHALINRLMFK